MSRSRTFDCGHDLGPSHVVGALERLGERIELGLGGRAHRGGLRREGVVVERSRARSCRRTRGRCRPTWPPSAATTTNRPMRTATRHGLRVGPVGDVGRVGLGRSHPTTVARRPVRDQTGRRTGHERSEPQPSRQRSECRPGNRVDGRDLANERDAVTDAILDDLAARGLVHDHTDLDALRERLAAGVTTVYAGFDPTADSLHIGNLVPLLVLRRFQDAGHRPIVLAGGATGMIGDPSGRSDERTLLDDDTLDAHLAGDHPAARATARLHARTDPGRPGRQPGVDRRRCSALEFLRDVGKHVTVNSMLAKDSVAVAARGRGRASPTPSSATCSCRPTTSAGCTSTGTARSRSAGRTSGATSPPAST